MGEDRSLNEITVFTPISPIAPNSPNCHKLNSWPMLFADYEREQNQSSAGG
jgi:hypothetical protein